MIQALGLELYINYGLRGHVLFLICQLFDKVKVCGSLGVLSQLRFKYSSII
jgi:hypothetical protein